MNFCNMWQAFSKRGRSRDRGSEAACNRNGKVEKCGVEQRIRIAHVDTLLETCLYTSIIDRRKHVRSRATSRKTNSWGAFWQFLEKLNWNLGTFSKMCQTFGKFWQKVVLFFFASKYAFFRTFWDLQDYLAELLNFSKSWLSNSLSFAKCAKTFCWIFTKIADFSTDFLLKFWIWSGANFGTTPGSFF